MKDWYDNIEKPVRPAVKLLRDHGINTTCSCGHDMYIEVVLGNHLEEVEHIANILVDNGYLNFNIDAQLTVPVDGYWDRRATIKL
jgi:hypothetical protein